MRRHEGTIRTLATVVVAFLINLVLDVAFDLPMLVRWGIALTVVLLLAFLVEVVRRRAAVRQTDRGGT
ncbi:hypothetical protein E4P41_00770 [Geodermatophilus sp. DF01-2]|uniref:hypothetical protein n=1 Tax=Geodermatophilus sp. DF01-2 TaxID=2559610 RepID=UPI00107428F8|nr:hypothetical protein [Geodermatophilus sp. DF01_2]TFV64799.1 hypothetical protein E4P41_00770 [Geodermatophilus sp. DF01_2]